MQQKTKTIHYYSAEIPENRTFYDSASTLLVGLHKPNNAMYTSTNYLLYSQKTHLKNNWYFNITTQTS